MVEAWVWSKGSMQKGTAQEPPDLTLDAICQAQPATAAPAPVADATEAATATDAAAGRLAGPLGMLLVIGAPLLVAAGWWVARQSRKAQAGEGHEE
jgi:hypothetical protein